MIDIIVWTTQFRPTPEPLSILVTIRGDLLSPVSGFFFFFFFLNPFACTLGYIALCSTTLCPILFYHPILSFVILSPLPSFKPPSSLLGTTRRYIKCHDSWSASALERSWQIWWCAWFLRIMVCRSWPYWDLLVACREFVCAVQVLLHILVGVTEQCVNTYYTVTTNISK